MFPINKKILLKDIPIPNRFSAIRKYDIHTGVDLFCDEYEPVYAIENGIITKIDYFTGKETNTPWWNDTMAVAIEGKTGIFIYGEILPIENLYVGKNIKSGEILGNVLTVLKKDKGLPMTMLHLELYKYGYRGDWAEWELNEDAPYFLLNSEIIFNDEF